VTSRIVRCLPILKVEVADLLKEKSPTTID
jgi:hypothetical protein